MLIISSREFRSKQGMYIQMAQNGEDVILKTRGNGSVKLVPVADSDMIIDKKYILKPDEELARAMPFDDFIEGAKNHIRKLYNQGNK